MLVDLGPMSQDKAVAACGYEGGATVVTFDNPGDDVSKPQTRNQSFKLSANDNCFVYWILFLNFVNFFRRFSIVKRVSPKRLTTVLSYEKCDKNFIHGKICFTQSILRIWQNFFYNNCHFRGSKNKSYFACDHFVLNNGDFKRTNLVNLAFKITNLQNSWCTNNLAWYFGNS